MRDVLSQISVRRGVVAAKIRRRHMSVSLVMITVVVIVCLLDGHIGLRITHSYARLVTKKMYLIDSAMIITLSNCF